MKRKLIYILFLLISVQLFGTTYYVSNSGSDSNDGLTTSTTWVTVSKVNGYSFSTGDSILFNRGDTWDERISARSRVVYGAYGTGDKPAVNGIFVGYNTSNTTIQYLYSSSPDDSYYPLYIWGSSYIHVYRCTLDGLENPTYGKCLITIQHNTTPYHDIIIEECEIRNGGSAGITFHEYGYNCQVINNIVHNNTETNIQMYAPYDGTNYCHDFLIAGNTVYNPLPFDDAQETGINIGWNSYNIRVIGNKIENCRVGIQADQVVYDCIIANNFIKNSQDSHIRLLSSTYGDVTNIDVYNNTIYSTNGDTIGMDIRCFNGSNSTGHNIKNNLIYSTTDGFYPINILRGGTVDFTSNYNCFYVDGNINFRNGYDATYTSLSAWQTGMSQDANSIDQDPLVSSTGYLSSTSPCIDAGVTIDTIDYDIDSVSRPQGLAYDIGAYEESVVVHDSYAQSIDLKKGWNMFSLYLSPVNKDMKSVMQELIDNKDLQTVQDESGKTLENWGPFGGWVNNIGEVKETEGYKISVNDNCVLKVTGHKIDMPLTIQLEKGWNTISYPKEQAMDALNVLQPLIDDGVLLKVKDEDENTIEPDGQNGWKNSVGNFKPGEGYQIKVSKKVDLVIE